MEWEWARRKCLLNAIEFHQLESRNIKFICKPFSARSFSSFKCRESKLEAFRSKLSLQLPASFESSHLYLAMAAKLKLEGRRWIFQFLLPSCQLQREFEIENHELKTSKFSSVLLASYNVRRARKCREEWGQFQGCDGWKSRVGFEPALNALSTNNSAYESFRNLRETFQITNQIQHLRSFLSSLKCTQAKWSKTFLCFQSSSPESSTLRRLSPIPSSRQKRQKENKSIAFNERAFAFFFNNLKYASNEQRAKKMLI